MYENYTYEQLKALPDDEKVIALQELKTTYPDNKDLAKHLDVAFIAVNNMVGKYLEGRQVGRRKMTDEEKAQAKLEREAKKKLEKTQEQQKSNEEEKVNIATTDQETVNEEKSVEKPNTEEPKPLQPTIDSFSIKLEKNLTGEEAISRINGIANSLLKESQYKISLIIEEVEGV